MDNFVKHALDAQGALPSHVTRDPYFRPAHSSTLFNSGSLDPPKLFEWELATKDESFVKKLQDMYALESVATGKLLFSWRIRQALGQYFVPTTSPSDGLLARNSVNNSAAVRRDILSRVVVEYARALAADNPTAYNFLEEWATDIIKQGRLDALYREMEVKQSREADIYKRHRQISVKTVPTSSITLYTSVPTTTTGGGRSPDQELFGYPTQAPKLPILSPSLPAANGLTQHKQQKQEEDDDALEYRSIDDQLRALTREGEKLETLDKAIEQKDHERYYNTLSLGLFAKCMAVFWLITIPFCIVCLDGVAIAIMSVMVITMAMWTTLLATAIPSYWGIDAFAVAGTIASFFGLVYLLLRTFFYNYGNCVVDDVEVFLLWVTWSFLVILTVFAISLSNAKKTVKGWNMFRKRPVQKVYGKEK